jgi:hypothetical protein
MKVVFGFYIYTLASLIGILFILYACSASASEDLAALAAGPGEGAEVPGLDRPKMRWIRRCPRRRTPYVNIPVNRNFTIPPEKHYDHTFYTYYLKNCGIDMLCLFDFIDASEKGNEALVQHYLQPGTAFWLPVDNRTPKSWLMEMLLKVFEKYNATTSDYIYVHVEDEFQYYDHPNIIDFYMQWKKVYRMYWWDTPNYSRLHASGRLDWIPLPYLKTPEFSPSQLKRSSLRQYNVLFRGNVNTNKARRRHFNEVNAALNYSLSGSIINTGGAFGVDLVPAGSNSSVYLPEMLESKLCLVMKGRSAECHRFDLFIHLQRAHVL